MPSLIKHALLFSTQHVFYATCLHCTYKLAPWLCPFKSSTPISLGGIRVGRLHNTSNISKYGTNVACSHIQKHISLILLNHKRTTITVVKAAHFACDKAIRQKQLQSYGARTFCRYGAKITNCKASESKCPLPGLIIQLEVRS